MRLEHWDHLRSGAKHHGPRPLIRLPEAVGTGYLGGIPPRASDHSARQRTSEAGSVDPIAPLRLNLRWLTPCGAIRLSAGVQLAAARIECRRGRDVAGDNRVRASRSRDTEADVNARRLTGVVPCPTLESARPVAMPAMARAASASISLRLCDHDAVDERASAWCSAMSRAREKASNAVRSLLAYSRDWQLARCEAWSRGRCSGNLRTLEVAYQPFTLRSRQDGPELSPPARPARRPPLA